MSEATIFKPLVHHRYEECDSELIDHGIGLSWRNASIDFLLQQASYYERQGGPLVAVAHMLFYAAVVKEDAIKHGINLEDKL